MKIEDGKLVTNAGSLTVSQKLPEVLEPSTLRAYQVPREYREDQIFVSVTAPGQPEEIPACSPADVELIGQLQLEPSPEALLQAAKQRKRDEVSAACQAAVIVLAKDYPEVEILSWPQQITEAMAISAGATEETPLLDAIAAARELEISELARRVLQKMQAYAAASGALIGQRQRAEDLVDAAQDLEQVEAVQFEQLDQ